MTWLLMNIPLCVLFFALWTGVPMRLVLKHPDTRPELAAAPAVRTLHAARHDDASYRRAA